MAATNKKIIDVKGRNNEIKIADGAIFHDLSLVVRGNGNKLYLGKGIYTMTIELIGDNNSIIIGDGCTIFNSFMSAQDSKRIIIGEGCLFANPTYIRTTDHHPIFNAEGQRINLSEDVIIGDRVWLATQINILKGSHIESDVVIGVGAVVTGHIPANSVAAGVPARVVRSGITWRDA
jgi:acetyltransferase-like isoleucine patch superfamily enzyme